MPLTEPGSWSDSHLRYKLDAQVLCVQYRQLPCDHFQLEGSCIGHLVVEGNLPPNNLGLTVITLRQTNEGLLLIHV